jgi:hypothetical protein
MKGMQSDEGGSSTVSITVLSVTPTRAGRLFGIQIELPQIPRHRRLLAPGVITLPEEVRGRWFPEAAG